jgi:DNA-binding Lrp family transcriptional regulator
MGINYRPSIRQAALRFDISEEVLQFLVELEDVEPILEDNECPLYRLEDIEDVVRRYRTDRDIAMVMMFRKMEQLDSKMDDLITELRGGEALRSPLRRFFLTRRRPPTKLPPARR